MGDTPGYHFVTFAYVVCFSRLPWRRACVCAGAVRVGLVDKEVVVNPTRKDLRSSSLNLVLAANENKKVG